MTPVQFIVLDSRGYDVAEAYGPFDSIGEANEWAKSFFRPTQTPRWEMLPDGLEVIALTEPVQR